MKRSAIINELNQLSNEQLLQKLDEFRRAQFGFKLNLLAGQVKDISQSKKLRKNIARVLTLLSQRSITKQ